MQASFTLLQPFACIFWLLMFISIPATSAGNLRFERLALTGEIATKNDNLSAVRAAIQDQQGFIWFGGENGLGRFDGQDLVIYQSDPENPRSISGNFVWTLALDHDGILWVGTGSGLNRYNPETNDFDRFGIVNATDKGKTTNTNSINNNNINTLAVDQDNNLIIGTASGMSILNPKRTHFQNYYPQAEGNNDFTRKLVRKVFVDKQNRIWVGTSNSGLHLFDRETATFFSYQHNPQDPSSLIDNDVASIEEDHQGRLWIGTYGHGLSRMNPDGKTFTHYRHNAEEPTSLGSNNVSAILEDSQNNLWVATDHGGLNRYQPATDNFVRFTHSAYDINTLSSNNPRHIYEDDQSNLWIGMFPTGVTFLDQSAAVFTNYFHKPDDEKSLSNNGILTFLEERDGILWIGTEDGLNSFDRKNNSITRYFNRGSSAQNLKVGAVLSIEEDGNGELWIGTWSNGLYRFNKKTGAVRHYFPNANDPGSISNAFIWKIIHDQNGILWLATETGGLNRYHPDTDTFTYYVADPANPDAIISNQLWTMIEDSRGGLWIGTREGLDYFDTATNKFIHFLHDPQNTSSISSNQIISLQEDSRGNIWVGTRDAGVNIYSRKTGTFTTLSVRDGLPSATISSIIEDDQGNIWITTVNGIARIERDTHAITSYNRSHGLISNNFNRDASFKDRQGNLYLGSIGGFSVFDPQKITVKSSPPPVVITDFKIFGKTVPIKGDDNLLAQAIGETKHLTLNYQHTMFSFNFAALSYRSPSNNQYAYMLEGFDQDWHNIGNQRTATYTNINPGHYVFKVKAANKDGVWNEAGAAIAIDITPPFWRTWWAYLGYALILLGIMNMINKYKNLHIKTNVYRILSATDPLTGVYNRAGIGQIADDVFEKRRVQARIGLLIIDIDYFKPINDIHGHDTGDRVLKEFARLISNTIRLGDSLARWGGEEFVLLCPLANRDGMIALAEKIRKIIAEHTFDGDHSPLSLTASIGVACTTPTESFEGIFKRADIALYEAKSQGRNRIIFAETETQSG